MEQTKKIHAKTSIRWPAIVGAAVLVVVIVCVGVLIASYQRRISLPDIVQARMDLLPDVNAEMSTIPVNSENPADANSFRVVINQMITMENGSAPCNIQAENPIENAYDLRVCLYLQETGELLGATHRITRGKRVENITLNRELPAGEHPLVAVLELFDDKQNLVTQLNVNIALQVKQ